MKTTIQHLKNNHQAIFLMVSVPSVFILFFIDEGYYNFNWMKSIGSWLVFTIYTVVLFLGQYAAYVVLKAFYKGKILNSLSIIIGVILSLASLFLIIR